VTAPDSPRLFDLFVLNIGLQLFDAVATYEGLRIGWLEANPILVAAFERIGVGPALLLSKALACALLVLLLHHPRRQIVAPAMRFLAGVYCVMSLFPWLAKYLSLLVQVI
jgi:hypothetical protein